MPPRRYLDDMEIQELVDLESSAQRKSEAKQLAAEAEEQIMHDHYDEGLAKYTEANKLDPDSKAIADQRKTAQEKAAEAKKSKEKKDKPRSMSSKGEGKDTSKFHFFFCSEDMKEAGQ